MTKNLKNGNKIWCLLFLLGSSGCVMNKLDPLPVVLTLNAGAESTLKLEVDRGPHYSREMQAGPLIFNILPQMVFWWESDQGQFIKTLYVSGADGKEMRNAKKNELGADYYRQTLPYWSAKLEASGGSLPRSEAPYPDTITSVTPANSFKVLSPNPAKPMVLYCEINQAADYNETYTEQNSGWVGQPSVVYSLELNTLGDKKEGVMKLRGSPNISDRVPVLKSDTSSLTTALSQISEIRVSVE